MAVKTVAISQWFSPKKKPIYHSNLVLHSTEYSEFFLNILRKNDEVNNHTIIIKDGKGDQIIGWSVNS